MKNFYEEVSRGLDKVVVKSSPSTWVNANDVKVPTSRHVEEVESATPVVEEIPVEQVEETQDVVVPVEEEQVEVREPITDQSVSKVLSFVGDDKELAQRALEEESAKETPRKTLIEGLEEVLAD